jgi:hypothetical protein
VELLATPMVHSGEINGEWKRGSRCGDDAWRRGRRGGHGGTTAKEGGGATKTQPRRAQQRRAGDSGGGGRLTSGVGWHNAGQRGSNGI